MALPFWLYNAHPSASQNRWATCAFPEAQISNEGIVGGVAQLEDDTGATITNSRAVRIFSDGEKYENWAILNDWTQSADTQSAPTYGLVTDLSSQNYSFEPHSAAGSTDCSSGFIPDAKLFPHCKLKANGAASQQTISPHPDFATSTGKASPELVESSDVHRMYLMRYWVPTGLMAGFTVDYWVRIWTNQDFAGTKAGGIAEWWMLAEWHQWNTPLGRMAMSHFRAIFRNEVDCPLATADGYSQGTWDGTRQILQWNGFPPVSGSLNVIFWGTSLHFYGEMYLRPAETGNEAQYTAAKAGRVGVGFGKASMWDGYWSHSNSAPPPINNPGDPTNGITLPDLTSPGSFSDLRGVAAPKWSGTGGTNGFGITYGGPWIADQLATVDHWAWIAQEWGCRRSHPRQSNGLPWVRNDQSGTFEKGWLGRSQYFQAVGKSGMTEDDYMDKPGLYDGRQDNFPGTHWHSHFFACLQLVTWWPSMRQWTETAGQWVTHNSRWHPQQNQYSTVYPGETRQMWRQAQAYLTLADVNRDKPKVLATIHESFYTYYLARFLTFAWSPTANTEAEKIFWVGVSARSGDCRKGTRKDMPYIDSKGQQRTGSGGTDPSFEWDSTLSMYQAGLWLQGRGVNAYVSEATTWIWELLNYSARWNADGTVEMQTGEIFQPPIGKDPGGTEAKRNSWQRRAEPRAGYFDFGDCETNCRWLFITDSKSTGIFWGWTSGAMIYARENLAIGDPARTDELLVLDHYSKNGDWTNANHWTHFCHSAASMPGVYGDWALRLTADWTAGNIDLTWANQGAGWTYDLMRSTTRDSGYSNILTGTAATTHSDTTVTEGTQYYYKVKAYHPVWSNITYESFSEIPELEIGAPNPDQTTSGIAVGWNEDTSPNIVDYDLEVATSPFGPWTLVGTDSGAPPLGVFHSSPDAADGEAYYYRVAVNYTGGTIYSRINVGMWDSPSVAPDNGAVVLTGAGQVGQNHLEWESVDPAAMEDFTVGGGGYYQVWRDGAPLSGQINPTGASGDCYDQNTGQHIVNSANLTYDDTTASVGVEYDYEILIVDNFSNASLSNVLSLTRPS